MPRSKGKPSIGITIIGAGTLATALASALRLKGHRVLEIVSRDNAQSLLRARKLAKRADAHATTLRAAQFTGKLIWLCVPDDVISDVASQLVTRANWQGKIAIHSSGAVGSDALARLKEAGASTASAHPLMTFVSAPESELAGVPFAMEGDRKALVIAGALVRSIGGEPFPIAAEFKPAYHLFGFFSSPALVALMSAAQQVGELAGFGRPKSRKLMEPIIRQTFDNFFRSTAQQAFSGPLRRGDIATLRKHLEVLKGEPELLTLYKSLAGIALAQLPVTNADALRKLLG